MRAILIAYLFVGYYYASEIPLGKGPDETAHVRYIEFLATEHRLPVFDPANPDPDYEFHQPPLYYALALPVYFLAGSNESAQQAVRLFTLLLSLSLIYLTFALGRALAPDRPWAGVAAAGVVAFLPMQLSVATTIGNDALTEVLAAVALLLMVAHVRAAAQHRSGEAEAAPGPRAMAALGLVIGLAMLTKSIALLLLPVAWLAALLAARGRDGVNWRQLGRDAGAATGVALLVCGWWLARNQLLYGDPLAQKVFLDAFQGLRPSPQSFMEQYEVTSVASYVGEVMIWTAASATGVFGPVHGNRFVFFPGWLYFVTGLIAVGGAIGFARYCERSQLQQWQKQAWGLCGAFAVLLLASFVRFNFSFFQAQARYLFPVLPAAAVALALGLRTISPNRSAPYVLIGAVGLLAVLAFAGLHAWIAPQFVRP
jgi:4-amino-4-deoxy-L-arabinose transferase-like glycosyltransferase